MLRVGPWLSSPYPERVPADAVPPDRADRCDRCPALPLAVFWKTCTHSTGNPHIWPRSGAGVLDLQLCGHHADGAELVLESTGWVLVLDRRQSIVDAETR